MVRQALKVVTRSARPAEAYGHLTSVRGIAAKDGVQLLGELLCLPEGMSVREWVAQARRGLRGRPVLPPRPRRSLTAERALNAWAQPRNAAQLLVRSK